MVQIESTLPYLANCTADPALEEEKRKADTRLHKSSPAKELAGCTSEIEPRHDHGQGHQIAMQEKKARSSRLLIRLG